MRKIFGILIVLISSMSFGQGETNLDVKDFDVVFLDSLVFEQINAQRLELNKPKIYKSQPLADKSRQHSELMSEQNRISYSEDRVGQCVLSIMLPLKSVITYEDLAELMLKKWLLSPGHKDLLMGEFFVYGGGGTKLKEMSEGHYILMSTFQVSYKE